MTNALHWMITAKSKIARLESKAVSIEDKMKEIRLVNKAKWLLIDKEKMAEPDAHRYIEKEAMDRCVSKSAVAEEIIRKYS
jgi:response regulator NasT